MKPDSTGDTSRSKMADISCNASPLATSKNVSSCDWSVNGKPSCPLFGVVVGFVGVLTPGAPALSESLQAVIKKTAKTTRSFIVGHRWDFEDAHHRTRVLPEYSD